MAVTSVGSATQAATIGVEHILDTETGAGVYVLVVELTNMVNGDILELRLKTKAATGATSRLAYMSTFSNIQSEPNSYSIPVPIDTEIIATLKQTAGTGRNFLWNLLKF